MTAIDIARDCLSTFECIIDSMGDTAPVSDLLTDRDQPSEKGLELRLGDLSSYSRSFIGQSILGFPLDGIQLTDLSQGRSG